MAPWRERSEFSCKLVALRSGTPLTLSLPLRFSSASPFAVPPRERYSLPIVCGLSVLYAGLYLAVFLSFRWAPLLLVALAPFALAVCGAEHGGRAIGIVTLASAILWYFGNLFFATYNWAAVLALALLHAGIIGVCGLSLRWWYRATRLPLALLLPATFVAGEFLRLLGPLGIPTGLIALPFHDCLWLIQIADVGGIYAVSFVIASVNGALADIVMAAPWRGNDGWRLTLRRTAVAAGCWALVAGYGVYRLYESKQTMRPGPVVGVVQPDIPMTGGLEHGFDRELFLKEMQAWSNQSAASEPPAQLVAWPEAMPVVPPLNTEWLRAKAGSEQQRLESLEFEQALREWTTRSGVSLLVGTQAVIPQKDKPNEWFLYNSAIRFDPGMGQHAERQDKQRLFPISESIPWPGTFVHTWLKRWVASHSSIPALGWYTRGTQRTVFELPAATASNAPLHYAVSMCVELCYAEDCGTFLRDARGGKAADFFVNMSNDGIFQRNRAAVLHASMSSFRAVEARVGIARSSNTGISGFVKPTGERYGEVVNSRGQSWTGLGAPELPRIAALVKYRREHQDELETNPVVAQHIAAEIKAIEGLRREAGVSGQSTQRVFIDSRRTLYSRTGDWFAWTLVAFTFVGLAARCLATLRRPARS
jgi:apolipoprotein N-acyltransferase